MISGRTEYYAILGNPIEQALSPIIQNAAFEARMRSFWAAGWSRESWSRLCRGPEPFIFQGWL